jgi:hypothetical protein
VVAGVTSYGLSVFVQHAQMLADSGIPPDHARARGYVSVDTKSRLEGIGVTKTGRNTPGLLVPSLRKDGSVWGYQYRPDTPRLRDGKPCKYETPTKQRNGIDVPPGVGPKLDDPKIPLWVTEGVKKADSAAVAGLCCVALPGVWSWRGSNDKGGKTAVPDWHDIALNDRRVVLAFDSDVVRKRAVRTALDQLAGYLASKGARVEYLHLPDDDQAKTGLDDYLADGHKPGDLWRLVKPDPPAVIVAVAGNDTISTTNATIPVPTPHVEPVSLTQAQAVFRRWLHLDDDDMAPMLVVAATIVANLSDGDPVWLLIVGPPSGGKTEILMSCAGLPYMVPAATVSEAALLSGTSQHERAKDATGGLMRQIGAFGILLAKDFTSVLSQNKDTAKAALAALREIYDGSWHRPVGADGGRVLKWAGKCGLVGGVTPSYDRYLTVVATLGDRFLLLRMLDVSAKEQVGSALDHGDHEKQMRAALAEAMTGLIAGADHARVHEPLTDDERDTLGDLAIFAARARTAVERDSYTGDLLVLPQAEGPARLVKAMRRLYGGLGAIGVDAATRWDVLARVAVDCAPAIRVPLIEALLANSEPKRTADLAEAAGLVTKTASRQLDDLTMVGIAERTKESKASNSADLWEATSWLREHWPATVRQKSTYHPPTPSKGGEEQAPEHDDDDTLFTALGSSLSREVPQVPLPRCQACNAELTAEQASLSILCPLCLGRARADEAAS